MTVLISVKDARLLRAQSVDHSTKHARAKGREASYYKIYGREAQEPVNRKPRLGAIREGEMAEMVPHSKGLQRPKIATSKRIYKIRKDDFFDGIICAKGV